MTSPQIPTPLEGKRTNPPQDVSGTDCTDALYWKRTSRFAVGMSGTCHGQHIMLRSKPLLGAQTELAFNQARSRPLNAPCCVSFLPENSKRRKGEMMQEGNKREGTEKLRKDTGFKALFSLMKFSRDKLPTVTSSLTPGLEIIATKNPRICAKTDSVGIECEGKNKPFRTLC